MPFLEKVTSALEVGAKTWRPKTAEQQYMEAEQKRLGEEEQLKRQAIQKKIETLENVRKIEAKTQALNEIAMAAEIRSQEHEVALKERQVREAKRAELAKLELAKRLGRESLSEADLARIRRERMRAELLARAAGNHAVQESMRPVKAGIDLGRPRVSMPPPPPSLHPLPPPMPMPRVPSAASHRMPTPMMPPLSHPPMPRPPIPMPVPPPPLPMEDPGRMRRISGGLLGPSLGAPPGRGQWGLPSNALRGSAHHPSTPNINSGLSDRSRSTRPTDSRIRLANLRALRGDSLAPLLMRAQAERLRRRRLEQLDLNAREHNLRIKALRDLRKRELMAKLRARGLQEREIDAQVRLIAEREQAMTEAQLREIRDREHRLLLQEKGLQEREIQEQIRRDEEKDRELFRLELARLERELRRKELLDAELAIRHALERGESPPMGVSRPTIEEIDSESLLSDDFFDDFESFDPRLRQEILAQAGLSGESYRGTHNRTPSVGTLPMRSHSPRPNPYTNEMRDRIRDEQTRVSEENRMREGALFSGSRPVTPRTRDEILSQMTPRLREETLENERRGMNSSMGVRGREGMLGDSLTNNQPPIGRPRSQSFDRRSPALSASRIQDENRIHNHTPISSQHRRTPSMRDNLDYDPTRHLDLPPRSASRASSRGGNHENLSRPVSRSGSIRDGLSPTERLGLPSRPASRNLTVEDLGLNFSNTHLRSASREREPVRYDRGHAMGHATHDDLLAARLKDAAVNSELNGGRRSRANSHADRVDEDLLRSARSQLTNDSSLGLSSVLGAIGGRRSRANSRAEPISEDLMRSVSRNQLGADLSNTGGRRSRAGSISQGYHAGANRSPRPSEFSEFGLQDDIHRSKESRTPSRGMGLGSSPGYSLMDESGGLGGLTNEELAHLSNEQLEMLFLQETGHYPRLSYDSMPTMTREEISQLTPEQLDAFLASQDEDGGTRRGLSRRSSRVGLGDSPPFGQGEHGLGLSDTAHAPLRSGSRNENETYGSRYGGSGSATHQGRSTPHNASSLYNMPGQYDSFGVASDVGFGASSGQEDLDTGEFVVTEANEPRNARIFDRLGLVEADSLQNNHSTHSTNRHTDSSGTSGMHLAVNNLIDQASRIGANGVVRLRVTDHPDGRWVASGEAVVLG